MAKNKIQDLRDHLFETLEALKDKDEPMDVARAPKPSPKSLDRSSTRPRWRWPS